MDYKYNSEILNLQLKISQLGEKFLEEKGKTKDLTKTIKELEKELKNLQEENENLKELLNSKNKNYNNSDKIINIVDNIKLNSVSTDELREKLDYYITVIDQSIKKLSNS